MRIVDEDEDLPLDRTPQAEPTVLVKEWRRVTPVLSETLAKKQNGCLQTGAMGPQEIEPCVVYWDWAEYEHVYQDDDLQIKRKKQQRKQVKFLLLPEAIKPHAYHSADVAIRALKKKDWQACARSANGQPRGRKLTLGWLPQLPGRSVGSDYYNVRTAPTLAYPDLIAALYQLLQNMDDLLRDNLHEYHNYAWNASMNMLRPEGEKDDLSRIEVDRHRRIIESLDSWDWTYTIRGTVFSTVELNRNIIFKAHPDRNNVNGTCVCITTLGSFAGGRLVFPRYGYSAELAPRDVLVCDNNKELHGNLGPIVGERFSVVAYQHKSLLWRTPVTERIKAQYSSGRRTQVDDLSASVMSQIRTPLLSR